MALPVVDAPVPAPAPRRGLARLGRRRAVLGYAVLLATWTWLVGMPNDTIQVFLWLWLGVAAWRIEADPPPRHLDFLLDWWPALLAFVVYFYSRGLADNLRGTVAVMMPIDADRWLFGGTLPTEALQDAWCGSPCDPSSDPRWWDFLFTTVYASHFLTGLTVAAVLWVRNHHEFTRWLRRLVAISYGALAVYVAYPMAPPWWAANEGYLTADLPRITGRGWDDVGLSRVNLLLGGVGNKVAAMPSLHAGIAFLVAVYAVLRLTSRWRWLLLAYPVAMGLALVYLAEHYVIDIIAGWALATVVLVACSWWERARRLLPGPAVEDRADQAGGGLEALPVGLDEQQRAAPVVRHRDQHPT